MHGRAQSQPKPKATSFSSFSKDYIKNLSAASSLETTEGIISENSFAAALDGLLEKSAGVREKSFLHTAGLLQSYSIPEWSLESNQVTLMEAIKKSFRNSSTERCLGARTAALYAICLGTESEPFYEGLKSAYNAFIASTSDQTGKSEAICSWATLAFIVGDTTENLEFIDKCMAWLASSSPEAQTAILNSIAFCCSSLPSKTVTSSLIPKHAKVIGTYVAPSYELSVRIAAAQLISLFFEFHRDANEISDDDYDPYVLDGYMDVTQIIEDLENFKGKNKTEQKRINILFAGYGASIEQGFCPIYRGDNVKAYNKQLRRLVFDSPN